MRHIAKLGLMAGGAVVTGITAYFVGTKIASASPGRLGCSPNNPLPMPSNSAAAKQVAFYAPMFRKAWAERVGGDMPPGALEIAFAQSMLETGIDTWWTNRGPGSSWADGPKGQAFFAAFPNAPPQGDMRGSHNLGARQCGNNDSGGADYTCVPYGDSQPDAQGNQHPIQASFRYYKTPEAGARDFIHSITKQWPAVAELKAGDVLGYAIRQGPKYRKDDPPGQKVFGRNYNGGNGYYGGFGATMQDRVGGYAIAIASHLPMVAAALGHDRIYACIAPELVGMKGGHLPTAGIEGDEPNPFCSCVSCSDMSGPHVHAVCQDFAQEVSGHSVPVLLSTPTKTDFAVEGVGPSAAAIAAFASGSIVGASTVLIAQKLGRERKDDVISPEPTPKPSPVHRARVHVVRPGDSPYKIAVLYNVCHPGDDCDRPNWWAELAAANPDKSVKSTGPGWKQLFPGDKVVIPDEWPVAADEHFAVEGAGIAIAAAVISAIVAAIAGAVLTDALRQHAEGEATDVVKKLRAVGIDYVDPGAEPRKGWLKIQSNDPRLLKALEYLGDKRDRVLQSLASKGFTFQAQPRIKVPPQMIKVVQKKAAESHAPDLELDRMPTRQTVSPAAHEVAHTAQDELVFAPATTEEAARRTFEGEADVTPESAAASDAYAASRDTVEGVGTTVAIAAGVVAAGLAVGAGVAAVASKAAEGQSDPALTAAMSPQPTPTFAPSASRPAPKKASAEDTIAAAAAQAKKDALKKEYESGASEQKMAAAAKSLPDKEKDELRKAFETNGVGEALQTLYLSGALPRARALPGSDGARFVWYVEPPIVAPVLGAQDEPSEAAKATSTAFDVSNIVKSVTSIVDAGDSIARRYKKDDPACLKAVRDFVERHPLVTRLFAKDLIPLTKVGIGDASMFADRYVDELMRQRLPLGDVAQCEPTPEEDRAVLGALMAPLGLSKAEEDAVYTAASRTAATALDLYAPGSGQGASQAADAISALITGRQMGIRPSTERAKGAGKPKADAALAQCRKELDAERAKVAVATEWAEDHRILAALTSPDLRKLK